MDARPQPIGLEDLLAHSAWIRRLARRLVDDPARADDVVQDAWVAVLDRPPAEVRDTRAWLTRVVQNFARQRARSEGARARRERAVGEREDAASPAEVLERFELHQQLSSEVSELAEPYRTTVLLRYYEGLSAAEIARRDGVPAGTVRWRLKQGVDQLRERLDARHGGDRRAWAVGLVAFVREPAPVAAAGAQGWLGLGRLLQVALVLVLGGLAWRLVGPHLDSGMERDAEPAFAGTAGAPRPAVGAPVDRGAAGAGSDDATGPGRVAASVSNELAVLVLDDATGAPVGGARVHFVDHGEWGPEAIERVPMAVRLDPLRVYLELGRELQSDAQGRVALSTAGAGGGLLAEAGGRYARAELAPGHSEPITLRLRPVPRARVAGPRGEPMSGVPVELCVRMTDSAGEEELATMWTHATDAAGIASFPFADVIEVPDETPPVSLRLGVTGAARQARAFDPAGPHDTAFELSLPPTAPVEVVAVGLDGEPLELDGDVTLTVPGRSWSGADATMRAPLVAGRARFAATALNTRLEAEVQIPARGASWKVTSAGAVTEGEPHRIDVVEPGAPAVAGRVIDGSGEPVRETELYVRFTGPENRELAREKVRTDSAGGFLVELAPKVVEAGSVRATVLRHARGGWRQRGDTPHAFQVAPGRIELGDLRLRDIQTRITGRCVDRAGAPLAGIDLSAPQDVAQQSYGTRSDADGRFEFDGLLPQEVPITIRHEELVPVAPVVARPGDQDVDVVLAPGGSITGSVALDAGIELQRTHLAVVRRGAQDDRFAWHFASPSPSDGRFTARGLPAGRYRCELLESGQVVAVAVDVLVELGREVHPPELQAVDGSAVRSHSLRLRVLSGHDGQPIPRPAAAVMRASELLGVHYGREGSLELTLRDDAATHLVVTAPGFRPRELHDLDGSVDVLRLERGLSIWLRGDHALPLVDGERRATLSLQRVDAPAGWPAMALEVSLPPALAEGREVELTMPAPGRYQLMVGISQPAGGGLMMAGMAEPVGEEFALEVAESDAGRALSISLPESLFE